MDETSMLAWLRVFVLICCLGIAARSDYASLTVRNRHWMTWSAPVTILLISEMVILETAASNFYMVAALLSISSLAVLDAPDPRDIPKWEQKQLALAVLYLIGIVGLFGGASQHANPDFVLLVLGEESPETMLWWSMIGAFITVLVYLSAWRFGLIQGGADAKALILLTVLMPSWAFLPEPLFAPEGTLFKLPPSMVMFLWASAVFLLAPPILIFQNAMRGNIESRADLKMAWHATKRPIEDIGGRPVWLLTEVIPSDDDADSRIVNRFLPGATTPTVEEFAERLAELQSHGVESAWIATKHPFIVYLFFAIAPLLLIGDPMGILASMT
tara:strand:- start:628 stop:1614 length:987 start_codon:yes stop_codon:yes gene_type:complete